jgi:hypothetical protein
MQVDSQMVIGESAGLAERMDAEFSEMPNSQNHGTLLLKYFRSRRRDRSEAQGLEARAKPSAGSFLPGIAVNVSRHRREGD